MSTSLTSAMSTALGRTVYEPGIFVEIGFSTPVRIHDRQGTKTWNSLTWSAADVRLTDLAVDNGAAQRCSLSLFDSDNSIAQQCRSATGDVAVKVWLFDRSALANADPVQIFEGMISTSSGGDTRRLRIDASVRTRMLPVGMLAQLLPAYMFAPEGTVYQWGTGTVTLSRRGEYA